LSLQRQRKPNPETPEKEFSIDHTLAQDYARGTGPLLSTNTPLETPLIDLLFLLHTVTYIRQKWLYRHAEACPHGAPPGEFEKLAPTKPH
jgi:hypothetical protein